MKTKPMGARLNAELVQGLEKLAELTGRPKSWHLAQAVESYLVSEQQFVAAVEEGLADLKAGRTVSHADVADHFAQEFKKPLA